MTFNIKDHAQAERNENDHDLVCCACSTLLYTFISALDDYILNPKEVVAAINDSTNNGTIPDITIRYSWNRKTNNIANTILTGYKILEKNYKKNVKVLTTF